MSEHTAESDDAPPTPSDLGWSAWATLANNVSEALAVLPERPPFSERNAVADALWRMGYRPSEEQIAAEIERQRRPEHHRDCPARYYTDHPERCRCSILRELDRSGTAPAEGNR